MDLIDIDIQIQQIKLSFDDKLTIVELFKIYCDIHNLKINFIKNEMNELAKKQILNSKFNILSPYLNYILNVLVISYPNINKYIDQIIQQLILFDQYIIHPLILNPLLVNLIHNSYINDLITNPELKTNEKYIQNISNIYTDVEIAMSISNDIWNISDQKFANIESLIDYNNINMLDNDEFKKIFHDIINNDIKYSKINLKYNLLKLNVYITHIDHMTQYNSNEFFDDQIKKLSNLNLSNLSKFDQDLKYFYDIQSHFKVNIKHNQDHLKLYSEVYGVLSDIAIDNLLDFSEKNILYLWIDNMSSINGVILDKIFKTD